MTCCAARQSVVRAANIVGVIALASENPLSYDREFPRPPVRRLSFVHASGDRVVHPETIVQLCAAWRADTCVVLESRVRAAVMDCAGDDIAHGTWPQKAVWIGFQMNNPYLLILKPWWRMLRCSRISMA